VALTGETETQLGRFSIRNGKKLRREGHACGTSEEEDLNEKRTLREKLEIGAVTHHENHEP